MYVCAGVFMCVAVTESKQNSKENANYLLLLLNSSSMKPSDLK